MASDGHETRRSEMPQKSRRESARTAPPDSTRVSLPYYRPPKPHPRELRGVSRGRILTEARLEGARAMATLDEALPDVAVASFGSPIMYEAVIGTDDRVKVAQADLQRNPFRQICALRIASQSGSMYVGTGWFIGPRAVATAGHCVYLHEEGGWAASIDVIPAKYGSEEPYARASTKKFRAVDGWVDDQRRDLDYAVILIDDGSTPGDRVGWFNVADRPDSALTGAVANISGYPADREQANFQYFHARPLRSVTPMRLEYDVDTYGGQSGSPVWIESPQGAVAVGVHTNGAVSGNSGTRITEQVVKNFATWRDE